MRRWAIAVLALLASAPLLADAPHPFSIHDLVMLDRPSDPQLSPDGRFVAYELRETGYAANKGVTSLWLVPTATGAAATAAPRRLTAAGVTSVDPRWRADGRSLYFLSGRSGSSQVWKLDLDGGEAQQVTHSPLDIESFRLSPDGRHLVASMQVFLDCATLACTRERLDARAAQKDSGELFDHLFVRHWDTWSDGRRSQLFAYTLDVAGMAAENPLWVTRGIDGDVPSKPEGDEGEYAFTPDSRALIFSAALADGEAWQRHFDLYRVALDGGSMPLDLTADNQAWETSPAVSPDGKTLAYLGTRHPGRESDRFGVMLLDLASGKRRELLPDWPLSADGLEWSTDGRTLYTSATDAGQKRLFAIEVPSARLTALTGEGTVKGFDVAGTRVVYGQDSLSGPVQLFQWQRGGQPIVLTHHNEARMAEVSLGAYEQFSFAGWNDDSVRGYLVKPVNFQAGKKYPVVLMIHGGPEVPLGNEFHYRWNPQTYAGAGFAVVLIDFHGTPGYGQAFTDAMLEHWGDRPLEDLQKGWKYVLGHYDFLDGTRACAIGASYGGFMIDWIAGNWNTPESGAWKCLVSHDGVFDTRMQYYSTEELWFEEAENGGTAFGAPQNYEQFNPVDHVADWKVPMLIVHNALDYRIPIAQGLGAFTALQRRGIPSEFLTFPDENHWVLKPQNSVQWHETVEAWLKRWTAP